MRQQSIQFTLRKTEILLKVSKVVNMEKILFAKVMMTAEIK
jgi:hypothetical protein